MKWPFLRRRMTWVLVAVFLILVVVFTQCELTRCSFDIAVNSGRRREQRFVLGALVSTRVSETPFSKAADELSLSREPPDWQFADSVAHIAGGKLFERGVYGQAAAVCEQVSIIFELYESEEREYAGKREAVRRLLDLMQKGEVSEMRKELERVSREFRTWTQQDDSG